MSQDQGALSTMIDPEATDATEVRLPETEEDLETAEENRLKGVSPTRTEVAVTNNAPSLHHRMLAKLRGETPDASVPPTLWQQCVAECFGTAILVVTGVGAVCTAVTTGAHDGLWQTAVIWGFGASFAILATASISGAHINPAVSFGFAVLRPEVFSFKQMFAYWGAQMLGGLFGGIINYLLFSSAFAEMENNLGIVRGEPESILTAMAFGAYFPNPGVVYAGVNQTVRALDSSSSLGNFVYAGNGWTTETISAGGAFGIEMWCGAVLMFVVLAVTDSRSTVFKNKDMAPYFIGFTIATLIGLYGPFTQGSFNPARDFGPRLAAVFFGWGSVAIPGPKNGFWVYLIAPTIGTVLGGSLYDFILARGLRKQHAD